MEEKKKMDMTEFRRPEYAPPLKAQTLMDLGVSEMSAVIEDVRKAELEDEIKPVIDLTYRDVQYAWFLNETNKNTLIEKHGKESDDWIGKAITIQLEKTDYKGKTVDCLRVV